MRLQIRQGVLGGEGDPVHRLCAATPRWGARRHRAGSIPPSKIPGEHPFWVHDTLQCGCTRLPGLHPSSGTAPVSQGCTQILECTRLWELHPTLGAAPISQGVPISWGALILRSCTHLQGLHPSVGAISQGSPIFHGVHPSLGATLISWGGPIFRACTHLASPGGHPSPGIGAAAAQGSAGMPRLLLSPSLGVSPCAALGACWAAAGTQCCCPRVPATGCGTPRCGHRLLPRPGSRWRETGYF